MTDTRIGTASQAVNRSADADTAAPVETDISRYHEVDAMVATATAAAKTLRELDQQQVDAIVAAMVCAGIRSAAELARVAIEETGFGVFEDKVVKNYIATEFLYDYLRDTPPHWPAWRSRTPSSAPTTLWRTPSARDSASPTAA
ncbi:hypothetical protein AB0B25_22415 [Nocardia sp. NPDC049190]|uniref:hypothetical protein n=1 Tax=Nocardia sp. NPDC049190 TaxID=3155650 RepID=UPI003403A7F3